MSAIATAFSSTTRPPLRACESVPSQAGACDACNGACWNPKPPPMPSANRLNAIAPRHNTCFREYMIVASWPGGGATLEKMRRHGPGLQCRRPRDEGHVVDWQGTSAHPCAHDAGVSSDDIEGDS